MPRRAENIAAMEPQLVADVRLYSSISGGRKSTAYPGWGCPCVVSKKEPIVGYDGFPQLGDLPFNPGDERRLGFVFLSEEGANVMRRAGRFYLWAGGFIGEAQVIPSSEPERP